MKTLRRFYADCVCGLWRGLWKYALGFIVGAVVLGTSGCSLFEYVQRKATQGNLSNEHWYVEKIVIDGVVFYAPQVLAASAQKALAPAQYKPDKDLALVDVDSIKKSLDSSRLDEMAHIDEVATLSFDPTQGRISGRSGCGTYFASYVWGSRDSMQISSGSSTRKLCSPNEVTRFEFRFIRDLEGGFKVLQKQKEKMVLESKKITIYLYRNSTQE